MRVYGRKEQTRYYCLFVLTSTFLHKPVDCRRGKDEYGKRYGSILVYRDRIMAYFFGEKEKKMRQQKKVTTRTDYSLFARKTVKNIFETFNTSTLGLSAEEVLEAREAFGENKLPLKRRRHLS